MQSIKNTGVAIMLLFLSYGVYQVIMKPMPEQQSNGNIDFSVTDPLPETQSAPLVTKPLDLDLTPKMKTGDESMTPPLQPIQSSVVSQGSIPRQILELPNQNDDQGLQKLSESGPGMVAPNNVVADLSPPSRSQADLNSYGQAVNDNDFGSFQPKTELALNNQPPTNQPENQFNSLPDQDQDSSQYESTPLPPQLGSEIDSGPLSDDTSVVTTGALTNVAPRGNATTSMEAQTGLSKPPLAQAWPGIESQVESGNFKAALSGLSRYYHETNIQPEQRTKMLQWLDALAARVIYSSEHHLRSLPYVIQPGDTIATLARDWQIPAQLIYNVNADSMPDPNDLTPGVEIKMIQGPFDAELDSSSNVLTLFLDEMYAGRFAVASNQLAGGEFRIVDKSASQKQGRPFWIQLSNGTAIYGSDSGNVSSNEIALNTGEAEELFSILSATSSVRVVR